MWVSADCPTDRHEFCDVEAAFPEFEFRYESLPLPETLPKFYLRYAGVLSGLHQQLNHAQIKVGAK